MDSWDHMLKWKEELKKFSWQNLYDVSLAALYKQHVALTILGKIREHEDEEVSSTVKWAEREINDIFLEAANVDVKESNLELREKIARMISPHWFPPEELSKEEKENWQCIVNNYPDQHLKYQKYFMEMADRIIEIVKKDD